MSACNKIQMIPWWMLMVTGNLPDKNILTAQLPWNSWFLKVITALWA